MGCIFIMMPTPAEEVVFTLSGTTFLSSGTFFAPSEFRSPGGVDGFVRVQAYPAGGSGIASTGAGGGGAYAEDTVDPGVSQVVTVATAPAAGASGGPSSFGALVIAAGGNSPSGAPAGQGGQASASTGAIRWNGADGDQGGANRQPGGAAGSAGPALNASRPMGGPPDGAYGSLPGALSGWPGGGGGSTAGSANLGRPGLVRVTYQLPSLRGAPIVVALTEHRDTADAVSRVVPAPVEREVGDLLILFSSSHENPTIEAAMWADAALAQVANGVANSGRLFYRTATATAADDATVTTSTAQHVNSFMVCVRGHSGPPTWTTANGPNSNVTPIANNPGAFRPSLAFVFAGLNSNAGPLLTSTSNNFEGLIVLPGATTTVSTMAAAQWHQFNGTGITPGAWANTSTGWVAGTVVVPGA